jgi:hypothetical protein
MNTTTHTLDSNCPCGPRTIDVPGRSGKFNDGCRHEHSPASNPGCEMRIMADSPRAAPDALAAALRLAERWDGVSTRLESDADPTQDKVAEVYGRCADALLTALGPWLTPHIEAGTDPLFRPGNSDGSAL